MIHMNHCSVGPIIQKTTSNSVRVRKQFKLTWNQFKFKGPRSPRSTVFRLSWWRGNTTKSSCCVTAEGITVCDRVILWAAFALKYLPWRKLNLDEEPFSCTSCATNRNIFKGYTSSFTDNNWLAIPLRMLLTVDLGYTFIWDVVRRTAFRLCLYVQAGGQEI